MFPKRVVIDTGVLVSRVLQPQSLPAHIVRVTGHHCTILISDYLLSELEVVLKRPKFQRYVTSAMIDTILHTLTLMGEHITPLLIPRLCRDPKDDPILALAIAGKADVLISGDQDLLCLDPLEKLRLLSPRQFLDLYGPKAD